jgi:hypothetical protein
MDAAAELLRRRRRLGVARGGEFAGYHIEWDKAARRPGQRFGAALLLQVSPNGYANRPKPCTQQNTRSVGCNLSQELGKLLVFFLTQCDALHAFECALGFCGSPR